MTETELTLLLGKAEARRDKARRRITRWVKYEERQSQRIRELGRKLGETRNLELFKEVA
jgi:hypothetical protein